MSAEIIHLPLMRFDAGNGAREALIEVALTLPNATQVDAEKWADWILIELWMRDFKVDRVAD